MPDLRDRLHRLADDITDLPRPPAEEVRRRAERRLRNGRTAGAAVALTAAVAAATTAYVRDDPPARLAADPATPSTAASATSPPALAVTPWLPVPWVLEAATSYTWPAGKPSSYAFCGRSYVPHWPVTVREQRLAHPDGRRALLLEISPAPEDPYQIFKWSYASCLVEGRAEGVGGPRNLWSYGTIAAGSEPVGARVHLLEMTAATRADVATALDVWAGR